MTFVKNRTKFYINVRSTHTEIVESNQKNNRVIIRGLFYNLQDDTGYIYSTDMFILLTCPYSNSRSPGGLTNLHGTKSYKIMSRAGLEPVVFSHSTCVNIVYQLNCLATTTSPPPTYSFLEQRVAFVHSPFLIVCLAP